MKTICIIGAFDTKAPEHAFVRNEILARGHQVLTVNVGTLGTTDLFPVDVEADRIAAAGGADLHALRATHDRGAAMKVMSAGAPIVVAQLYAEGRFDGIIGMGGSGGTSMITAGMRALPVGLPKLCVSTVTATDISGYVGLKDIVMMPSIVDVAGINRISRIIFARAAGAICGMVEQEIAESHDDKPLIAASMFGNTTECVNRCMAQLTEQGYEVLVFHATGTGGRTMESLVREGLVDGVLDITTTEWADEICRGLLSAGPERLDGPGELGVPHLIVPGCVDMANFGGMETVPARYKTGDRLFYEWNPAVTLMRTNREENRQMGKIFAEKANAAKGPVAFLLPLRGVSILDGDGERFCDRAADQAMFAAIKETVRADIPVVEIDCNINDAAFAEQAVAMMLALIGENRQPVVAKATAK